MVKNNLKMSFSKNKKKKSCIVGQSLEKQIKKNVMFRKKKKEKKEKLHYRPHFGEQNQTWHFPKIKKRKAALSGKVWKSKSQKINCFVLI